MLRIVFRVSILLAFQAAIARTGLEWVPALREYEANRSLNHLSRSFIVIHIGNETYSGFGRYSADAGPDRPVLGEDPHFELDGLSFRPYETDSVFVNGIIGTPSDTGWWFMREKGVISGLSRNPSGDIGKVRWHGKECNTWEADSRRDFQDLLKTVPEAYSGWRLNRLDAIQFFNRAMASGSAWDELAAMAEMAEKHCRRKVFDSAVVMLGRMENLEPGNYRASMVKAHCAERQSDWVAARDHYLHALHGLPKHRISEVGKSLAKIRGHIDHGKPRGSEKSLALGMEGGVGLPFSLAGIGASLSLKVASCRLAFVLSTGAWNLTVGTPLPEFGIRLYAPGYRYRAFVGAHLLYPFPSSHPENGRMFGSEIGLSIDPGRPGAWKFQVGAGYAHQTDYEMNGTPVKGGQGVVPHLAIAHEF